MFREGLMSSSEMSEDGRAVPDPATVQLVLKEAKDLIRALEGTATSRVSIRSGALSIEVERDGGGVIISGGGTAAPAGGAASGAQAAAPGVMSVVAPLVGVFYRSGSPGAK